MKERAQLSGIEELHLTTIYVAINIHFVGTTGTNNGGKKAVSYAHVVHIYSNLLRAYT